MFVTLLEVKEDTVDMMTYMVTHEFCNCKFLVGNQ